MTILGKKTLQFAQWNYETINVTFHHNSCMLSYLLCIGTVFAEAFSYPTIPHKFSNSVQHTCLGSSTQVALPSICQGGKKKKNEEKKKNPNPVRTWKKTFTYIFADTFDFT